MDNCLEIPAKFKDTTNKNDVCPSYEYVVNNKAIKLWVQPENQPVNDTDDKRYTLSVYSVNDDERIHIRDILTTDCSETISLLINSKGYLSIMLIDGIEITPIEDSKNDR